MIVFELFLNGRKVTVAGAENLVVLSSNISAVGKLGRKSSGLKNKATTFDLFLSASGLSHDKKRQLEKLSMWCKPKKLKVGDEIRVIIKKANIANKPKEIRTDLIKMNERKQFEMAKETYLRLRKKYEKKKPKPTRIKRNK